MVHFVANSIFSFCPRSGRGSGIDRAQSFVTASVRGFVCARVLERVLVLLLVQVSCVCTFDGVRCVCVCFPELLFEKFLLFFSSFEFEFVFLFQHGVFAQAQASNRSCTQQQHPHIVTCSKHLGACGRGNLFSPSFSRNKKSARKI